MGAAAVHHSAARAPQRPCARRARMTARHEPPGPAAMFRPYKPGADLQSVQDICAKVYGGTDYIPRVVEALAQDEATCVLVAANEHGELDALGCAQRRGAELFLFGLRVREGVQRRGLGGSLLAELCRPSRHQHLGGRILSLVSTTIPQNQASRAIFRRLHFEYQATVEVWPAYADLHGYEAAIGWPQVQAQPDRPLVDSIAGARELLDGACRAADCALSSWRRCGSSTELRAAIASVRRQQSDLAVQRGTAAGCLWSEDWMPWAYEVHPVEGEWLQARVAEGDVWVLPRPGSPTDAHAHGDAAARAVVVLARSTEFRRHVAGILVAHEDVAAPAVAMVASRHPHFVCFVDRGSRNQGEDVVDAHAPALYRVSNHASSHHSSFLVLEKPLSVTKCK